MKRTIKKQERSFTRSIRYYDEPAIITVTVRHDDRFGNGHNTFSITGGIKGANNVGISGCIHDEIVKFFPELAYLIKWHLVSTDGPMHYVGNTIYHAGDTDHRGLRKGEVRQLRNGRTGQPVWEAIVRDSDGIYHKVQGMPWLDSDVKPDRNGNIEYIPVNLTGDGKTPDLDAARRCAVWPDATLEQLRDKDALLARLPALLAEFRKDVEALGFTY